MRVDVFLEARVKTEEAICAENMYGYSRRKSDDFQHTRWLIGACDYSIVSAFISFWESSRHWPGFRFSSSLRLPMVRRFK